MSKDMIPTQAVKDLLDNAQRSLKEFDKETIEYKQKLEQVLHLRNDTQMQIKSYQQVLKINS